ncbi:MAG: hypothetical protein AAF772_10840 [Acidobacteriota bacterium]
MNTATRWISIAAMLLCLGSFAFAEDAQQDTRIVYTFEDTRTYTMRGEETTRGTLTIWLGPDGAARVDEEHFFSAIVRPEAIVVLFSNGKHARFERPFSPESWKETYAARNNVPVDESVLGEAVVRIDDGRPESLQGKPVTRHDIVVVFSNLGTTSKLTHWRRTDLAVDADRLADALIGFDKVREHRAAWAARVHTLPGVPVRFEERFMNQIRIYELDSIEVVPSAFHRYDVPDPEHRVELKPADFLIVNPAENAR